ncbi:MAG: GntR family transcriptional regulator [Acidimicrobiales bacterium]
MADHPSPEPPVVDRLRAEILSGALLPGERLIELGLAERYGVGRAAIRAALVELDGEGLVQREAHRGAMVRRVSLTEAIEITEARGVLEGLLARRAAERATADERIELGEIVAGMERAVAAGALADYSELNRRFHQRLREIAHHEVSRELVDNLRNRAVHHQYRLSMVPGRADESLEQHRAVAAAVVAGDAGTAETAMREHLDSVAAVLRHWNELGVPV